MKIKRLFLQITVDPDAGFCFGVRDAIQKAEDILLEGEELFCVGQIVHNDEEVERLEKLGLKTIDLNGLKSLRNKKIMFRAHGEPPSSYEIAEKNKNEIIDATCPVVLKLQQRVKTTVNDNKKVLIYGKKDHPEIIGLLGQGDDSIIVAKSIQEIPLKDLPKRITLYSQTTSDTEKYQELIHFLESAGIEVDTNKTICGQVSGRRSKLEEFCKNYDKIIFVAGKNSSNGKVLFAICKNMNPKSFYISSPDELSKEWFLQNEKVGITGGTSTPIWLMEKVKIILKLW